MKRLLFLLCSLLATAGVWAETFSLTVADGSYVESSGNYVNLWTAGTTPVLTVTASANNMDKRQATDNFLWHSGSSQSGTYTFAVPGGYLIKGLSVTAKANSEDQTLTNGEASKTFTSGSEDVLALTDLSATSVVLTLTGANTGVLVSKLEVTVEEDPAYVDPLAFLTNDRAYTLTTSRGSLGVFDNSLVSTAKGFEASTFALVKYDGAYYLWSVAAGRFINGRGAATNYNPVAITLKALGDDQFQFLYGSNAINVSAGYEPGLVINSWTTLDDGNRYTITEAEPFDATTALDILANPLPAPTYTYVSSVNDLSNDVAYAITNKRGTWSVATGAAAMGTKSVIDTDAVYEQFALLKHNDNFYIYSVNAKAFLTKGNTLGDPDPVTISETGSAEYPFFFAFDAEHNINVNSAGQVTIDTWNYIDDGNSNAIIEAASFDPTEALEAFIPVNNAEGDITADILLNPSFELSAAETPLTEDVKGANGPLAIYGWTMETVGESFNNTELLQEGSTSSSQFGTSAPSEGKFSFFFRQGWNGAGNVFTLTANAAQKLPAGNYILSVDYKQHYSYDNDNQQNQNTKVGLRVVAGGENLAEVFSEAAPGVKGSAANTYFATTEWSTLKVPVVLTETVLPQIQVVLNAAGARRSDFFIDNVRLVKVSEADLARAELESVLDAANSVPQENVGDELFLIPQSAYDALVAAVQAAQGVDENSEATAEELRTAISELNAALETYKATPKNLPAEGETYTLKQKASGLYLALDAANNKVLITGKPQPFTWEVAEDGFYLTNEEGSVNLAGTNAWSMSVTSGDKLLITPVLRFVDNTEGHVVYYVLNEKNGVIGTDTTEDGATCYANKAQNDNSLWAIELYVPQEPTAQDVTDLIQNPAYLGVEGSGNLYEGWTYTENGFKARNYESPLNLITYSGNCEFEVSQTLKNVPAGLYKLTVNAFYRAGSMDDEKAKVAAGTELEKELTMYAATAADDTYSQKVMNLSEGAADAQVEGTGVEFSEGKYVPNSASDSRTWYIAGEYTNEVLFNVFEQGDVTIGLKKNVGLASDYCPIGGWKLYRLGDADATAATPDEKDEPTPTPERVIEDGVYYIYNATTDKFMSRGSWWGTRAVADEYGLPINVTMLEDGKYTLQGVDNGVYYGDDYWMYADCSGDRQRSYTMEEVEGGYKLINPNLNTPVYINIMDGTGDFGIAGNGTLNENYTDEGVTVWQFLTLAERDAIVAEREAAAKTAAFEAAGIAEDATLTEAEAVSITFQTGSAWTFAAERSGSNAATNEYGTEIYQGTGNFTQKVEGLEAGLYKVAIQAFYRDGSNAAVVANYELGYNLSTAYLDANGTRVQVKSWAADCTDDSNPNGMDTAAPLFAEGKYLSEGYAVVAEDGVLDLRVAVPNYITFGWFMAYGVTYAKVEEEPAPAELAQEINIERYVSLGYNATVFEPDFTETLEFLGIEDVKEATLTFINPDGTEVVPAFGGGTTDGWCDENGALVGWDASISKICVKFNTSDADYMVCDMNGADVVGATYTVKYALSANGKKVVFTINVAFVEKTVTIPTEVSDLVIEAGVEYTDEENADESWNEKVVTLTDGQVASILAELGLSSLDEADVLGYNPSDGTFIIAHESYDGWRNADGDFELYGDNAPFCVKYTDGVTYLCYDKPNTTGYNEFAAYWAISNGTKAVLVKITFTTCTAISGIEADTEAKVIYDLNGRRVAKAVKGVYIINGKKVVVK